MMKRVSLNYQSNPLSSLPKDTTSELACLFSTLSLQCWTSSREAMNANFSQCLSSRKSNSGLTTPNRNYEHKSYRYNQPERLRTNV